MLLSESNWRSLAAPVSVAPLSPFAPLAWADMAGEKDRSGPVFRNLSRSKVVNVLHGLCSGTESLRDDVVSLRINASIAG